MKNIVINGFKVPIKSEHIRVGRSGEGSCLQPADLPSALSKSVAKHDNTVVFVRSPSCPHCHQALPVMEAKCNEAKNNGVDINFLDCPTTLPHCTKILDKVKSKGVPTTVLIKKNKSIDSPEWKVIGADIDDLEKRFNKIMGKTAEEPAARQVPQPQPNPPTPQQIKFGVPDSTYNLINNLFANPSAPVPIQQKAFCMPGYDKKCTNQKFNSDLTRVFTY